MKSQILLSVETVPTVKVGDRILFCTAWRSQGYDYGWCCEDREALVQKVNKKTVWVREIFPDGSVSTLWRQIARNRILGVTSETKKLIEKESK